jgi:hypothetical protein
MLTAIRRTYGDVEILDEAGESDYQGWWSLLCRVPHGFVTAAWSYGSCDHCDPYERLFYGQWGEDSDEEAGYEALADRTEFHTLEAHARMKFDDGKGW